MENLKDKLKNLGVSLIGNRVTALGIGMSLGSIGYLLTPDSESHLTQGICSLSYTLGTILCFETFFGSRTAYFYNFTKKHIANKGRIDERFVERVLNPKECGRLYGYCEQQGVYLALRDAGMKEDFKFVKERSRNIIPNF